MTWRAHRIADRFASVAVSVKFQNGTPNRRAISLPTHAASSVGSISVMPLAACVAIASTLTFGACPAIPPVSPRQKSTNAFPSTSQNRAPSARSTKTG